MSVDAPVPILRLDLIRHGAAAPAGPGGDAQRPLTPAGAHALEALGARYQAERWALERIVASPLVRARESAAAFLSGYGAPIRVEIDPALAPDEPAAGVLEALRAGAWGPGPLLAITHQPLVGSLVEILTGARPPLAPGALARIELPRAGTGAEPRGVLTLHLPPLSAHL